jgi:hypothetical protein
MTSIHEDVSRAGRDRQPSGGQGTETLKASLVISTVGVVGSLVAWVWANSQQVNYDELDLTGVFTGSENGFGYVAAYLAAMFFGGLVALLLAVIGAAHVYDRAWRTVLAGAMAMFLVMVPVVFVAGHEVNHWGGCILCGSGGGTGGGEGGGED